ncbi:hypothetical protein BKA80DRAFT_96727 [Phyllosticta citrichinensis]
MGALRASTRKKTLRKTFLLPSHEILRSPPRPGRRFKSRILACLPASLDLFFFFFSISGSPFSPTTSTFRNKFFTKKIRLRQAQIICNDIHASSWAPIRPSANSSSFFGLVPCFDRGIDSLHSLLSLPQQHRLPCIHWYRGFLGELAVLPEIDRVPFPTFLDCAQVGFQPFDSLFFRRVPRATRSSVHFGRCKTHRVLYGYHSAKSV